MAAFPLTIQENYIISGPQNYTIRQWLELTMALTKFRVQFTLLWNKQLRLVVVCDVS